MVHERNTAPPAGKRVRNLRPGVKRNPNWVQERRLAEGIQDHTRRDRPDNRGHWNSSGSAESYSRGTCLYRLEDPWPSPKTIDALRLGRIPQTCFIQWKVDPGPNYRWEGDIRWTRPLARNKAEGSG